MPKIFHILLDYHPEALQELVKYQKKKFGTKLAQPKEKEKSKQKRGKGW